MTFVVVSVSADGQVWMRREFHTLTEAWLHERDRREKGWRIVTAPPQPDWAFDTDTREAAHVV